MKQENLLLIIVIELALLLFGLYNAAQQAENAVSNSPLGKIGTALNDLGV